jgi:hypothetical protein
MSLLRLLPARRLRSAAVAVAAAASAIVLTATAASAAGPGFYALTGGKAAFQVLSSGNLAPAATEDAAFGLSTTGSGLNRLPFPLHAYNQVYKFAVVGTNGFVELGVTVEDGAAAPQNDCPLPSPQFGHPALMPYWDALFFGGPGAGHSFPDGVFVQTSGAAPHRTLVISWQGASRETGAPVLAQVVFSEGAQNFSFRYGAPGGLSATIGVQSKEQITADEWACNKTGTVTKGLRIAATHHAGTPPID